MRRARAKGGVRTGLRPPLLLLLRRECAEALRCRVASVPCVSASVPESVREERSFLSVNFTHGARFFYPGSVAGGFGIM